ncbi:carbohydrate esterase family 15 protein [Pterulicium gracile]|uniref:(4-O-methyl)-D-glucuronate--lignin esterase n=1 Tax=Pterulicium gracile TaxID=1884261 RepID=A0A5C3R3W8_9AGAR|nr:carbohydrate esterase family 15 protein [Pterula gracilis]
MFKLASVVALAVLLNSHRVLAAVPVWGQCGGQGWGGETTCVSGATCNVVNNWYSQCIPGTVTSNPPPEPSTPGPTSPDPTSDPSTPGPSPTQPNAACTPLPANAAIPTVSSLPDPFQFIVGGRRAATKADWECRRAEILELAQRQELGTFPPKPSSLTASFSGNTLTINASQSGKSTSFSVTISNVPSGTGPHPAIIAYGAASIPIPAGVAVIVFNNNQVAAQDGQGSRGVGRFYDLYGSSHSAGALTAWAWGVDRIIDAIELTPGTKLDPKRIGVTGCSRNGKGALIAGALVNRIALTIPQESGSGGAACWRLSDAQKASGTNVQTASQIIGENVWFSPVFNQIASSNVNRLGFDHHSIAALVAPRAMLVIENTSMEWLGNMSSYHCPRVARSVWRALGVPDNMGVSQVGHSDHCGFPSAQNPELTAFIQKFLLNQSSTNTNVEKTTGSYNFDQNRWVPWTTPTLT